MFPHGETDPQVPVDDEPGALIDNNILDNADLGENAGKGVLLVFGVGSEVQRVGE